MSILIRCDGCGTITPAKPSEYSEYDHDLISFDTRIGKKARDNRKVCFDRRPRFRVHACCMTCAVTVAERYRLAVIAKHDGSSFCWNTMLAKVVKRTPENVWVRTPFDRATIRTRWSMATGECIGDGRYERESQSEGWRLVYPAPTGVR